MTIMLFLFIFIQSILVRSSASIALDDFTPFGKDKGDILLHQGDDLSGRIMITTAFHFFSRNFTSLYVNVNGVISFKTAFREYQPEQFPRDHSTLIAPFWDDVDTRNGGAIWYRQTTSKHLLQEASTDVRKAFPEFPLFSAIWMFVVTWEKVSFYESNNENITNTFQSVLLTDGRYSFVRLNYYNISWSSVRTIEGDIISNGLGGKEAGCGFNAGFGNHFYNVTGNAYRNISVLDLPVDSNVNKPGVWMFRTDDITIQEPESEKNMHSKGGVAKDEDKEGKPKGEIFEMEYAIYPTLCPRATHARFQAQGFALI